MSLESLLKPFKWMDKQIQKQYTKIGVKLSEHIHPKPLYRFLYFTNIIGAILVVYSLDSKTEIDNPWTLALFLSPLYAPDGLLNARGIAGQLSHVVDERIAVDPITEFLWNYNKSVRLPTFLTGAGFLGSNIYDLINYLANDKSLTEESALNFGMGFGLFLVASSMYLKDQNPKLLNKSPSRVKEFLKSLYERVKDLEPSPVPAPQPAKIQAYSSIENSIESNI